jgi:ABC-2 type transport system permease protein
LLQVYKRFWQVNWAEQWQYRANVIMYLGYWLVSPITFLAVWTTIANAQGSVNGLTAADFTAYYLTLLPIGILSASIAIHILAHKIQDGTISNELLQPVHPVLTNTLVSNIAFNVLQAFGFVPIWLVLMLLFRPTLTYTWQSVLLTAPAVVMGFALQFLLQGTITLTAFWTTRVWAINEVYGAIATLLNGAFVPLALMPVWVQGIAHVLPFQLSFSFPILLLLNRLAPQQIALNFGLQAGWIVVLYALFNAVWRRAIKQYSTVGA